MKKTAKLIISIFLTLLFVLYIAFKIDWIKFVSIIQDLNYVMLIFAATVYFLCYYLRALRFKLLLADPVVKTSQLLGVSILHNFYNRVIPARLGDFSLIYLLKRVRRTSLASGINVFIFVKLYDLLISVFLLSLSYTVLYKLNLISIGLWIVTAILLFCALKPSTFLYLFRRVLNKISMRKIFKTIDEKVGVLIGHSKEVETNQLRIYLFFTSLGIWSFIFVFFYLLFFSLNQKYEMWDTLFATTLANFSWVLPINGVGGFGTMEVSMAFAFSMRGYSFQDLLVCAFYINVVVFILTTLFAIVPYFKILRKENTNEINHSNSVPE
ncbi:lysylphosphatidylglycerol synthase transmembrane domain-containing protein [Paenibacillus pinistramenti]|uniref:lysylphosphatidylglycerol synthase transmembrane domain-containing protein n=1 Tax=Paenibacillus pinistramenti TaxID=1768003 RepID=UPI001108C239|nr:lysylphosphatidylglycerol synthase transmembrane domain-containing protein [Paenibacillus pinistramenti]